MKNFNDHENIIWRGFERFYDMVMLSLCWLLCSLPVVTVIPASIALYDCMARCVCGGEGGMLGRFFRTFKNELGRGILLSLFWGLLIGVLLFGYEYGVAQVSDMIHILYLCAAAILLAVLCWVVAIESRFVYGIGMLHRNALIFTFGYLPNTLVITASLLLGIAALWFAPFLVFVVPGLVANLQHRAVEKVLRKYMPKEEE